MWPREQKRQKGYRRSRYLGALRVGGGGGILYLEEGIWLSEQYTDPWVSYNHYHKLISVELKRPMFYTKQDDS